ncbi:glycoside hydrolase family 5 protein [Butyrivibrio sp. JL13D10]|uniref:glycoside hydrolase family 5 protein n=1 Tax=Butyrivibrio sp. JL13D10 TaxID=3236815 RepID=UPI0038B494AE
MRLKKKIKKAKFELVIITFFLIFAAVISAVITHYIYLDDEYDAVLFEEIPSIDDNTDSLLLMQNIYKELGQGINLGNSLDVCDWTHFGSVSSSGFQAAVIYNTKTWTGWNSSNYVSFGDDGNATIVWEIEDLTSPADSEANNFAIQLVNHKDEYNDTEVACTIKNAKIKMPNGITKNFLKTGSKEYKLKIVNEVTDFIYLDISSEKLDSSDLIGAKVEVSLSISDFFQNRSKDIEYLEKYWGNPVINEEVIRSIKSAGFNTVRIPVTYFNHISSDGTIDVEFLDRVEQVVDWILENDMFCIIDIHHDTGNDGWIKASEDNFEENKDKVSYIFTQIATRFKDKDEHLILEGLNETVNDLTQWQDIPVRDLEVMNKWNQLFVDMVRQSGGRNSDRFLLVNTYAALSLKECLEAFKLPEDITENRLFVGIHCYFTKDTLLSGFETVKCYKQKYRFIIGEWAINDGVADRLKIVNEFMGKTRELQVPTIWWDNGNMDSTGIINRENGDWTNMEIVKAITREKK